MVWAQSPPRVAASMSGRGFLGWTLATHQKYKVGRKKISNICGLSRGPSVAAEYQRVALARLVDEVKRDHEVDEDLSDPAHVVAHLLGEKGGVGPGLTEDLGRGEEAVGMVEEELQQLELALGQGHLLALVPHHPAGRIQPQPLKLPEPPVPEIQTQLISMHLGLDDLEVRGGRLLCGRLKAGHVAPDPVRAPARELEEVGVDAHPVARVFPPRGEKGFPLKRPRLTPACICLSARRTGRIPSLLRQAPQSFQIDTGYATASRLRVRWRAAA